MAPRGGTTGSCLVRPPRDYYDILTYILRQSPYLRRKRWALGRRVVCGRTPVPSLRFVGGIGASSQAGHDSRWRLAGTRLESLRRGCRLQQTDKWQTDRAFCQSIESNPPKQTVPGIRTSR